MKTICLFFMMLGIAKASLLCQFALQWPREACICCRYGNVFSCGNLVVVDQAESCSLQLKGVEKRGGPI